MATISQIKNKLEKKGWHFTTSIQTNNNGKHNKIASKGTRKVSAESWTALFKKI